jgi:hypothetical protein
MALRRLGLDRVWWLVSPGNPLKAEHRLDAGHGDARMPGDPLGLATPNLDRRQSVPALDHGG